MSASDLPMPPQALMFMGEDHAAMLRHGASLLSLPTRLGLLSPDTAVMDIGCGCGRLAYALLSQGRQAPYLGLDIRPRQVAWLRENLKTRLPEGSDFIHLDVRNDRYNPAGSISAAQVRLPRAAWTPDLALVFSVFTHMHSDAIRRYVSELAGLLSEDAVILMTFFLLNKDARKQQEKGRADHNFIYRQSEISFATSEQDPLHAIAYDEAWIHELLWDNGLQPDQIFYGTWAGRHGAATYQDTLVVRRL